MMMGSKKCCCGVDIICPESITSLPSSHTYTSNLDPQFVYIRHDHGFTINAELSVVTTEHPFQPNAERVANVSFTIVQILNDPSVVSRQMTFRRTGLFPPGTTVSLSVQLQTTSIASTVNGINLWNLSDTGDYDTVEFVGSGLTPEQNPGGFPVGYDLSQPFAINPCASFRITGGQDGFSDSVLGPRPATISENPLP